MCWHDRSAVLSATLQDAVTCLKRRLQMDHPQKQYLAIILTSKVGRPLPGSVFCVEQGSSGSLTQVCVGRAGAAASGQQHACQAHSSSSSSGSRSVGVSCGRGAFSETMQE